MEKNSKNNKRIPSGFSADDTEKRIEWLKEKTGIHLDETPINEPEDLKGIIENHVGFMPIPMGIAGPLLIDGEYAKGEFTVPICTLEGTLAISMSRGMFASTLSGGISTQYIKQELSRAPVFIFNSLKESSEFMKWIDTHFEEIKKVAESSTNYGKLLRIDQYPIQNYVVIDMVLDTGNAAGQNMVTLAAKLACDYIQNNTGYKYILESGFNSDKKASSKTMIMGRGHSVISETTLKHSVLKRILGIHLDEVDIFQQVAPTVTNMAGTTGCHLHISNALTAIYLATGQDTACVAENSIGHFQTEPAEDGLKCRLTLPSITVGTVGGGTRLLPQQKNLELLGCHEGEYSSRKLAEIICASSLCLEISLMSAIASGTFTQAHMKYGRK
ncbi:MAG: hydroxymethylglutaryl-CoA reductase [Candidatus Marinimicrobia bacterium]|jgi:hydroxymethylglutaryl-CoA reductase (NADPH)|nr:hydroxymethylglutaryl-CoA reductase [Candidatus Neomarinimicrobiota bacterium]MBT3495932.1 hydroxymethylglutaryl-CoA reductase [Candidatus Neomarinimicrobiota bacterium]MBT3692279.1 hydroxymethylglutaryl-CoA reductase [Candidatus Neomarinimicrobiota bacterium]MBT4143832.1 hydroxymethylglutaryl-CoA reductase [Candidatus Neomarinimicrobiota bacterium]MBT4177905.1 hydroxymethylglutaryl-CoA reductase [Candidatus Neomarinimicrobiota bacterium]